MCNRRHPAIRALATILWVAIYATSLLMTCVYSADATENNVPSAASRDARVAEMAYDAITTRFLVSHNPQSQYICTSDKYACLGPDAAELGLATLGALPAPASGSKMLKVLMYRIDGGFAHDYTCYMLEYGRRVLSNLRRVDPDEMNQSCRREVKENANKRAPLFDHLDVDSVCASPEEIRHRVGTLVEAIEHSSRCAAGDF